MAASRASAHVRLIWGRVTPKRTGRVMGFTYTRRTRLSRRPASAAGANRVLHTPLAGRVPEALRAVRLELLDARRPSQPARLAQRWPETHVAAHLVHLPTLLEGRLQLIHVAIQRRRDHRMRPHELAHDQVALILGVASRFRRLDGRSGARRRPRRLLRGTAREHDD